MGTKTAELPRLLDVQPCRPDIGGCCSMHRRADRVYADQLWTLALRLGPGHDVFDPSCC